MAPKSEPNLWDRLLGVASGSPYLARNSVVFQVSFCSVQLVLLTTLTVWNKIPGYFLLIYFQKDATLQGLFVSGKLFYMFRVVSPPIIRSTHNFIYSIWYLSNCYCYLPLLWKRWNWFECGVGIVLNCFGAVACSFPEINKLCNVASCWKYIKRIILTLHGPLTVKFKSWIIFTYSPYCSLLCFTVTAFFKISSKLGDFMCAGTKMLYPICPVWSTLGVFILVLIDVFVLRLVGKTCEHLYMLVIWEFMKFDVQGSMHRKCIPKYDQQVVTLYRFYFCKLLHMFRVDPPPIIRSRTLYMQHLVFVKPLLLPTVTVRSSNGLTNTRCWRYSVVLLMMGGGSTRKM